ncbi:2OG-Fe(II) oxygenase [Vineibacter terrae]|uniref:2OG-Fe(II) oxygenase n=1 Tax=Vineibacter terrae TaxID=2586908 RepID=A0A5C8PL81_9HYPH|nr:2OG-Fe(II) oxygenase [Vineibacter terrae]TXL74774.1 2OG-Fe(II) oxygenase [Vineibacter terrae]
MNGPAFPFRPGDRVPDIPLPSLDGQMRKLQWAFQGEPVVLIALADARALDDDAMRILSDAVAQGATPAMIIGAAPSSLNVGTIPGVDRSFILCDAERRFLRPLLAPDTASATASPARRTLVLDANQRLVGQTAAGPLETQLAAIRDAIAVARADRPAEQQLLFGSAAPVLMLPRVFEPPFCRALIDLWSAGERADGGVASRYGNVMAADRKRTEDHIVTDQNINKQISDRLAYRIGPELGKVFAWDAEFGFDAHVIISYAAEAQHYFRAHRDNGTPQTADRTFAVSLNLNEDYDGGELAFPEYGPTRYKPKAGAAAVFSCSLLHEALPVTRGRRFVLTTFFRNRGPQAPQRRTS